MNSTVSRASAPAQAPGLVVQKTVTVNTGVQHAFSVFTEQIGRWWPLEKAHIGAQPAQTAILEPRVGGRWYERAADGAECDWGRVLVWDPPGRLVLAWEINSEWKHDVLVQTVVEVRFIPQGPTTTRVELEHRDLEAYGEKAAAMQDHLQGWATVLEGFVTLANATGSPNASRTA